MNEPCEGAGGQTCDFGGADILAAFFGTVAGFAEAVRFFLRRDFFFTCALRRFIFCEFLRSNLPMRAHPTPDRVLSQHGGSPMLPPAPPGLDDSSAKTRSR